jgi:hypothetical protein
MVLGHKEVSVWIGQYALICPKPLSTDHHCDNSIIQHSLTDSIHFQWVSEPCWEVRRTLGSGATKWCNFNLILARILADLVLRAIWLIPDGINCGERRYPMLDVVDSPFKS